MSEPTKNRGNTMPNGSRTPLTKEDDATCTYIQSACLGKGELQAIQNGTFTFSSQEQKIEDCVIIQAFDTNEQEYNILLEQQKTTIIGIAPPVIMAKQQGEEAPVQETR